MKSIFGCRANQAVRLTVPTTPQSLEPISDVLERIGRRFKWAYSGSMRLDVTSVDRAGDGTAVIHLTATLGIHTKPLTLPVKQFLIALETGLIEPTEDYRS